MNALRLKRPLALSGLLVALALLASACGGASTPAPAALSSDTTGSLQVLEWGGYEIPELTVDFTEAFPQVSLNYEFAVTDSDFYAKLKAGSQADLLHPCAGWLQFYVEDDLVEPIDVSRLSNWSKVPERFRELGEFNGKQYFVPWDWGFASILYRTDKIPEGVDSWGALMDPKYAGHVALWDEAWAAVAVVAYVHGWDPEQLSADQLAQIKQELIEQRSNNLFYWASEPEMIEAMRTGDLWAAYAWQGAYATLRAEGVPVEYAVPKEGRSTWVCTYAIRKGTPNYDLALAFMGKQLEAKTGANLLNLYYYGHVNQDAMASVEDPNIIGALSLSDLTILDRTNFAPMLTSEEREGYGEMWAEVKAAP